MAKMPRHRLQHLRQPPPLLQWQHRLLLLLRPLQNLRQRQLRRRKGLRLNCLRLTTFG